MAKGVCCSGGLRHPRTRQALSASVSGLPAENVGMKLFTKQRHGHTIHHHLHEWPWAVDPGMGLEQARKGTRVGEDA